MVANGEGFTQVDNYNVTDLIRDLETGTDIRITESGDTRITGTVLINAGVSYITAKATKNGVTSLLTKSLIFVYGV